MQAQKCVFCFFKKCNWMNSESWVRFEFGEYKNWSEWGKEEFRYFFIYFLLLDFFFFFNLIFFFDCPTCTSVVCCIPSYFFWFQHMPLAKLFCCPRIQLSFTTVRKGVWIPPFLEQPPLSYCSTPLIKSSNYPLCR